MATNGEEDSAKWLYVRPDPKMLVVVRRGVKRPFEDQDEDERRLTGA